MMTDTSKRPAHVSPEIDAFILGMWKARRDTMDMSDALGLPQADVANRLSSLLDQRLTGVTSDSVA